MDLRGLGLSEEDLRALGYDVKRKGGSRPGQAQEGRPGEDRPGRPAPPAPPRKWAPATRTWVTTVAVLVAVGWASSSDRWLPAPAPTAAPDTAFSSGRAMAQLVDVAQSARATGSPENERVREYLVGRLRSLGLEARVQTATAVAREADMVTSATVRNVVARVPGTGSTGAVLVTAHYDTSPLSPGAADDGIGVATVLEVVRAVLAGPTLRNDVVVLLTDGDELGGLGSRAFAEAHEAANEATVVLSVEARGASGPAIAFETGGGNAALVQALATADPSPTAFSLARALRAHAAESAGVDSASFGPLVGEGIPGLALTSLGDAERQHQPQDIRARVSEQTLQHGGGQLLAMTRALGQMDLREELARSDRVYLTVRPFGLFHYARNWVLLTTLALLAFWTLAGLVLRGRRATRLGVGIGAATGGAMIAAAAAIARTTRDLTADLHPEYGVLWTAYYDDAPHVLAVLVLTVAAAALLHALARRWARPDEIIFGGLTIPLLYAVWLSFTQPFAAPALQLPLATAMLGGAVVIFVGPNRARSAWTWAALLVLTAIGLALAVPSVELLAGALTLRSAGQIGAVLGLAALLLWPLMDRLLLPRWWWTPTAGIAAAAALVATTLPMTRDPDENPVPTTLVYLADEPVSAATPALARAAGLPVDTSRVRSMAGKWLTVPGPGEEWARSWAGEPARGSTDPGLLLLGPADDRYVIVGTAPVTELVPPVASVRAISPEGAGRTVDLVVERGLPGEMLGVHLPDDVPGRLVGVEGARWSPGSDVRSLVHWGTPAAGTGSVRIAVHVDPDVAELDLVIVEHRLRPREVVGNYFFQRPDSMVANGAVGSDRAIQRTRLTVPIVAPEPDVTDGDASAEEPSATNAAGS